jgi:GNAT superfamily N-acetyltransferase
MIETLAKPTRADTSLRIQRVISKKELQLFIDFPHELYRYDDHYVPELFIAQRDMLSWKKHPFHEHSVVQLFLAYRNDTVVGRIAAINNNNHNAFNNAQDGFFGFYDCINDTEVSNALLNAATSWLKAHGLKTIIGPVNFSTNETCGLLIEGFDSAPVIMMTYNRPYYIDLLESAGLREKVTLLAWKIIVNALDDKPYRLMPMLKERLEKRDITIRKVNMKKYKEEVKKIHEVYNNAWNENLGFVPMTGKEFDYLANDMKLIMDPDFCLVAEQNGKAIGFALCIPDMNQVFIKIKRGRLLPSGIFKLLFNRKKVKAVRVIALGVLEPYRKMGIEACFYGELIQRSREKGIEFAEASWILEHNDLMNNALKHINADPYKRYRIYEKSL